MTNPRPATYAERWREVLPNPEGHPVGKLDVRLGVTEHRRSVPDGP